MRPGPPPPPDETPEPLGEESLLVPGLLPDVVPGIVPGITATPGGAGGLSDEDRARLAGAALSPADLDAMGGGGPPSPDAYGARIIHPGTGADLTDAVVASGRRRCRDQVERAFAGVIDAEADTDPERRRDALARFEATVRTLYEELALTLKRPISAFESEIEESIALARRRLAS
jgi:hypothetical protein